MLISASYLSFPTLMAVFILKLRSFEGNLLQWVGGERALMPESVHIGGLTMTSASAVIQASH